MIRTQPNLTEVDNEAISGEAAISFATDAQLHPERYDPLAFFVAQRMRARRLTQPYIIDAGMGPGTWAIKAARLMPGAIIDGFDISPDMVALATQRFRVEGLDDRVHAILEDVRRLSRVMAQPADFVFSRNLLQRLPDPLQGFLALLHSTKPMGEAFATGFVRLEATPETIREFHRVAATKATQPQLVRTYTIARAFAHPYAAYVKAAHHAARIANAQVWVWRKGEYFSAHFQKG